MRGPLLALVVLGMMAPVFLPAADAASRQCTNGLWPAPVNVRCSFAVGSSFLQVTGAGFGHSPCGNAALNQPCYAGTMSMDITYAGGAWRKVCSQVAVPAGSGGIQYMENSCTATGSLPPGGKAFAVQCQSNHLTKVGSTSTPTLVPGGTGPFSCWVAWS